MLHSLQRPSSTAGGGDALYLGDHTMWSQIKECCAMSNTRTFELIMHGFNYKTPCCSRLLQLGSN
jgi:hypothetical protein